MSEKTSDQQKERISKRIARAGISSRRGAEELIEQGRVMVDGKTIKSPALNVSLDQEVHVDGKLLAPPEQTRLWRFHKPPGYICTSKDPQGRPTIFDLLSKGLPRVLSIGRLDFNTEGLILLTNDGDLSRHLELPSTGWKRKYRVRVHGRLMTKNWDRVQKGVTIDGVQYGPVQVEMEEQKAANRWINMTITEGKNREIRNVCAYAGLEVNRLIRTGYGPFQLGNLPKGQWEEVPQKMLKEQLGNWKKK